MPSTIDELVARKAKIDAEQQELINKMTEGAFSDKPRSASQVLELSEMHARNKVLDDLRQHNQRDLEQEQAREAAKNPNHRKEIAKDPHLEAFGDFIRGGWSNANSEIADYHKQLASDAKVTEAGDNVFFMNAVLAPDETTGEPITPVIWSDFATRQIFVGSACDIVRNVRTPGGNTLKVGTLDDTVDSSNAAQEGVATDSSSDRSDKDFNETKTRELKFYYASSEWATVAKDQLTDTSMALEMMLTDELVRRAMRQKEKTVVTGTGAGDTWKGLLETTTSGHTSAINNKLSYSDLTGLVYSVNREYRRNKVQSGMYPIYSGCLLYTSPSPRD